MEVPRDEGFADDLSGPRVETLGPDTTKAVTVGCEIDQFSVR